LVVQTADGGEKAYYLNPQRLMELRVESAQVTKTASSPDTSWFWMPTFATQGVPDQVPALTELRLRVVGNAVLEDGRQIGIVGEPGKESRSLRVCFYSPDDESRERREDSPRDKSTPHQWAAPMVWFSRANRRLGFDDRWNIECLLPQATLATLASAVSSGELLGLRLRLALSNIYAESLPPSESDWFLRPSPTESTTEFPVPARGCVDGLTLELASFKNAPGEEVSADEPDSGQIALQTLAAGVERLQSTVKVVGGLIAFFVLLLVFK